MRPRSNAGYESSPHSFIFGINMSHLIPNPPKDILITECMISCPICKTPLPEGHPAHDGVLSNKKNSIRAHIVDLRRTKKTLARDLKINQLVQELFDLDPDDAERFIEELGRCF